MTERHLYQHTHPINACPFEGLYKGSWCNVDYLRIKDGKTITHFEDHGSVTVEMVPIDNLRIRSRKSNLYDCTFVLRPNVDVCVLLSDPSETDSSRESVPPVWVDAKIKSIDRKPHENRCTCRIYVTLKQVHQPSGVQSKKRDVREVCMENISILQKFDNKFCEDGNFRWVTSKDSLSKYEAKLFRGQFMYDFLWLLVASTKKSVQFEISSVQNKITYGILNGDMDIVSNCANKIVNTINFRAEEDVLKPIIIPFAQEVAVQKSVTDETVMVASHKETDDSGLSKLSGNDLMYLRRSGRPNIQPERYFGDGSFVKATSPMTQTKMETKRKWAEQLVNLTLTESGDFSIHSQFSAHAPKNDYSRKAFVTSRDGNHQSPKTSNARRRPLDFDKGETEQLNYVQKPNNKRLRLSMIRCDTLTRNRTSITSPKHFINSQEHGWRMSMREEMDVVKRSKKKVINSEVRRKEVINSEVRRKEVFRSVNEICYGTYSGKPKICYGGGMYRRMLQTKNEYDDIIEECMKKIDLEIAKQPLPAVDQWEEIITKKFWKLPPAPPSDQLAENPDKLEDLWKEMEASMQSVQFLEKPFDIQATSPSTSDGQACKHDFFLDDQIGITCRYCYHVGTEIRDILPQLENPPKMRNLEHEQIKFQDRHVDDEFSIWDKLASPSDTSVHVKNESVWTLIPDLQNKLHVHQKKAFEFLWKNIAGSLMPADMDASYIRTGGCIIAHSPGAGKTLLIISFLVSYLKLFPGKRPVILAPKTILHTWFKEFKKWDVNIPVYQIHARKNYKKELQNKNLQSSLRDFKHSKDVMHTLDCLEKFRKWHEHASVLLMSYPSFLSIMGGNSASKHWSYMSRVLKESPGLLILDEGHNPRSTTSILRRTLMKVKTEHRVLLSGTLFQNNFTEYFNTLCLARPSFIPEVIRKLDPIHRTNRYKRFSHRYRENKARKFFVEKIAIKIHSKEERRKGLNMLTKLTRGFIDVYESGSSAKLPGLKSFRLLINPSAIQQEFLKKLQMKDSHKRYYLELELLVSFVSIHPWLITTLPYSGQYYSQDELKEVENYKFNFQIGSKVKFVISLVRRCIIKEEKVLIFCRNISPMKLFVRIFETIFGWTKDEEILILFGEQESFERSRVIDKFEDPRSSSRVLMASIGSCSEGISLTAASRVVLLDSEWNPSKTKQAVSRAFRPGQERVVYVYQLLASGTLEVDKYGKNTWKQTISRMISVGAGTEDTSCRQAEDIDDEVLKEILDEDHGQLARLIINKNPTDYLGS